MKALPGSLWLWVILPLFDIVKPDRTLDALMSPLLSTPMLLRVVFFFLYPRMFMQLLLSRRFLFFCV